MSKSLRSLQSRFSQKVQLHWVSTVIFCLIIMFSVLISVLLQRSRDLAAEAYQIIDTDIAKLFDQSFSSLQYLIPLAMICIGLLFFFLSFLDQKRLKGEIRVVREQIRDIAKTGGSPVRNLRTGDQLRPIMDEIHSLIEFLKTNK